MPLYDYTCESCGPFEARRPAAEAGEPLECPECGKPAARQFSVPVVANEGRRITFNPRRVRETVPLPSGSTAIRPRHDGESDATAPAGD